MTIVMILSKQHKSKLKQHKWRKPPWPEQQVLARQLFCGSSPSRPDCGDTDDIYGIYNQSV